MSNAISVLVALIVFLGMAAVLARSLRVVATATAWVGAFLVLTVVLVLQAVVGGQLLGCLALATALALVVVTAAVEIAAPWSATESGDARYRGVSPSAAQDTGRHALVVLPADLPAAGRHSGRIGDAPGRCRCGRRGALEHKGVSSPCWDSGDDSPVARPGPRRVACHQGRSWS